MSPEILNPVPQQNLQQQIAQLDTQELMTLLSWLKAFLKERKRAAALQEIPLKKGREVLETLPLGTTTYRLEKVKCGKKKCKCNQGKLHGPYWYAYNWNGKKLTSTYIGKKIPHSSWVQTLEPELEPEIVSSALEV